MRVTLLGSGNPAPQIERAGTGIAVEAGNETLLIDCGQLVTHRLVEFGIDFTDIRHVFFTHHHLDHNVGFHYFAIIGWFMGRESLTVYGPEGTEALVEGIEAYRKNIDAWRYIGGYADTEAGVTDIDIHEVTPGFETESANWRVKALPVKHTMKPTFAYRVTELTTNASLVFTSDTRKLPELESFAKDADILVHNCNARGVTEEPLSLEEVSKYYRRPPFDTYYDTRVGTQEETAERHSNPTEAAKTAANANADALVLVHFDPYRDTDAIREEAERVFDGDVYVAQDGLTLMT